MFNLQNIDNNISTSSLASASCAFSSHIAAYCSRTLENRSFDCYKFIWKIGGEGFAENHAACVPRKILGCTEIGTKCAQKVDYDSTFIFQTWPTVFLHTF